MQDNGFEGIETMWNWIGRRERDSNPRTCNSQRFSRPPHSTALPSLQWGCKNTPSHCYLQRIHQSWCFFTPINAISIDGLHPIRWMRRICFDNWYTIWHSTRVWKSERHSQPQSSRWHYFPPCQSTTSRLKIWNSPKTSPERRVNRNSIRLPDQRNQNRRINDRHRPKIDREYQFHLPIPFTPTLSISRKMDCPTE